jgi:hypothetical protein
MDETTDNGDIGSLLTQNLGWILVGVLLIYAVVFEPMQLSLGLLVFGCALIATRDGAALFESRGSRRPIRLEDRSREEGTSRRRLVRMLVMATGAVVTGIFLPVTISLLGLLAGIVAGTVIHVVQKYAAR